MDSADAALAKATFKQQLQILRKPPYRRTQDDLEKLVDTFQDVVFFKELESGVRTQVCRGLTLKHFSTGTTIFNEGDVGDEFYVILAGSIGIFVKDVMADDVEEEAEPSPAGSPRDCSRGVCFEAPSTVDDEEDGEEKPRQPMAKKMRDDWSRSSLSRSKRGSGDLKGPSSQSGPSNRRGSIKSSAPASSSRRRSMKAGPSGHQASTKGSDPESQSLDQRLVTGQRGSTKASTVGMRRQSFRVFRRSDADIPVAQLLKLTASGTADSTEMQRRKSTRPPDFSAIALKMARQRHKSGTNSEGSSRATSRATSPASFASNPHAYRKVRNFGSLGGHKAQDVKELMQEMSRMRRMSFDNDDTGVWLAQATQNVETTCTEEERTRHSLLRANPSKGKSALKRRDSIDAHRHAKINASKHRHGEAPANAPGETSAHASGDDVCANASGEDGLSHVESDDAVDHFSPVHTQQPQCVLKLQAKQSDNSPCTSPSVTGSEAMEALVESTGIAPMPGFALMPEEEDADQSKGDGKSIDADSFEEQMPRTSLHSGPDQPSRGDSSGGSSFASSSSSSSQGATSDEEEQASPTAKKGYLGYRSSSAEDNRSSIEALVERVERTETSLSVPSSKSCKEDQTATSTHSSPRSAICSSEVGARILRGSLIKRSLSWKSDTPKTDRDSDTSDDSDSDDSSASYASGMGALSMPHSPMRRQGSQYGGLDKVADLRKSIQEERKCVMQRLLMRGNSNRSMMVGGAKLMEVTILRAGASFGEVALQTNQARSATAKTREDTYCATLTRDDYKAILKSTIEKQHQDRQEFLCRLPLLEGLQPAAFNKIAAMLRPRALQKGERIYEWDSPILQVILAKEGEFAVCCRPYIDVPDEECSHQLKTNTSRTSATSFKRPPYMTVSLITPPCVFGLTEYIMGERKHRKRVMCKSVVGMVYSILGKELLQHVSRPHRERLQESALSEDCWYNDRVRVLKQLHAPLERRAGSEYGRKGWAHHEETVIERLALARGEVENDLDAYSYEGRLRTIGKVFVRRNMTRSPALKPVEAIGDQQLPEEIATERHCSSWLMEKVVEVHPDAVNPRYGHLLDVKLKEKSDEACAKVPLYVPPQVINYNFLARTAWKSERLMFAVDHNIFHFPRLAKKRRGRADGTASTTVRLAPVNLEDQRRCTAAGKIYKSGFSPHCAAASLSKAGVAVSSAQSSSTPQQEEVLSPSLAASPSTTGIPEAAVSQDANSGLALVSSAVSLPEHSALFKSRWDNVRLTYKKEPGGTVRSSEEMPPLLSHVEIGSPASSQEEGTGSSISPPPKKTLSHSSPVVPKIIPPDSAPGMFNEELQNISVPDGLDDNMVELPKLMSCVISEVHQAYHDKRHRGTELTDVVAELSNTAGTSGMNRILSDFSSTAQSWATSGLFSNDLIASFVDLDNAEASLQHHRFGNQISTTSLLSLPFSAYTCSTYSSTASFRSGATAQSSKAVALPLPPIDLDLVYNKDLFEAKWSPIPIIGEAYVEAKWRPVVPNECRSGMRRPTPRRKLKSLGLS